MKGFNEYCDKIQHIPNLEFIVICLICLSIGFVFGKMTRLK